MKVQGKTVDVSTALQNVPQPGQQMLIAYFNTAQDGGYMPAASVQKILNDTGWSLQYLMNILVPVATLYATPPISNFKVGAVVHGISGALYFGANIEFVNEALSFVVHAEQASIAHAISYGETGVDYLAISAAPCGYCRQFLYEITQCPTTPDINVLINNGTYLLSALLPQAFGPNDLGVTTRLMLPQANNMSIIPPPSDPAVVAALAAANYCYSPYTNDYSGVCIYTTSSTYTGAYAENAAYNPSMSPLEAALIKLIMSGDAFGNIIRAVLVEATNSKANQFEATTDVLSSIAPGIVLEYYKAN